MTVLELQLPKSGWRRSKDNQEGSECSRNIDLLTFRPVGLQKSGSYISHHAKARLLRAPAELHSLCHLGYFGTKRTPSKTPAELLIWFLLPNTRLLRLAGALMNMRGYRSATSKPSKCKQKIYGRCLATYLLRCILKPQMLAENFCRGNHFSAFSLLDVLYVSKGNSYIICVNLVL